MPLVKIQRIETSHETSPLGVFQQPQENPKQITNSPCCKIPNTNREFWVNKIRRNQERDQRNCQTLQDNGWQVLVMWECQLKANLLEQTMLQVEQRLLDNLIATLRPKRVLYKLLEETSLSIAAEPKAEYEASSCKSKNRN